METKWRKMDCEELRKAGLGLSLDGAGLAIIITALNHLIQDRPELDELLNGALCDSCWTGAEEMLQASEKMLKTIITHLAEAKSTSEEK